MNCAELDADEVLGALTTRAEKAEAERDEARLALMPLAQAASELHVALAEVVRLRAALLARYPGGARRPPRARRSDFGEAVMRTVRLFVTRRNTRPFAESADALSIPIETVDVDLEDPEPNGPNARRRRARAALLARRSDQAVRDAQATAPMSDEFVKCIDCGRDEHVEAVYCRKCESANSQAAKEIGRRDGAAVAFGLMGWAQAIGNIHAIVACRGCGKASNGWVGSGADTRCIDCDNREMASESRPRAPKTHPYR